MTLAILRSVMGVYSVIAAADFVFLVTGYLVARRFRTNYVLGAIIGVVWVFAALYMMLFLSMVLPGCPNGRWAC